jgi:hypothetical protein
MAARGGGGARQRRRRAAAAARGGGGGGAWQRLASTAATARQWPIFGIDISTSLQAMFFWRVVIHSGTVVEACNCREERISVGRVQVSA